MKVLNKSLLAMVIIILMSGLTMYGYTYRTSKSYQSYNNNKQLKQRYWGNGHRFPAAQARYRMGADPYLKPSFSDIPEQPNISGFEQESYNSPK